MDELTVIEHLKLASKLKGGSNLDSLILIAQETLLTDELQYKIKQLPQGSLKKLSLAMTLIGNSKLLIIEEPTLHLDLRERQVIW